MSTSSPSTPDPRWAWILGGVLAGLLAGAVDAGAAIASGIGGLGVPRGARLVFLSMGVLALAGAAAGAALTGLGSLLARGASSPASVRKRAAICGALIAAPLLTFIAFALFKGPRASRVPAHEAISIAVAVVGTVSVFALARAYGALLEAGAARRRVVAIALTAVALAAHAANRTILPRLYPWFHAGLGLLTFVLLLAAGRLSAPWLIGDGRRRVLRVVAATVVAAGLGLWALESSQVLRFAAHERTMMVSLALRPVAGVLQPRTHASVERQKAEANLPPLPDGPQRPDADVLLITIDALRADHLGAYGYPRNTTPHLDRLAAGGARFLHAYSQAPHTSFSVASMLTGKYFPTLARLAPGESHEPLAATLRTYGWRTAAFYPPAVFYVDAAKMKTYQETHFSFEYVKFEYIDAQRRVDQVLTYYDTVKPKKSFVWIHFFEPHEPYETHEAFPFGPGDVDRYDSEIAYSDAAVGRLVAETRKRRPGTVVIVAADHGEEFDEHGGRYHGSTLYEEQLRIPLIVSVPGVTPRVVDGEVQLIDVAPTVLNLLDIPVPARMRGTDLGPWLATPPAPALRLPPAFAEVEDRRMVVWRREKLLCDLHWGFCAYYDLAQDPGEKRNQAEEKPERAAAMRGLLDQWLDGHVRLEPLLARGASNPEGGPVPRAIERGRLGDLLAANDLAALMLSEAPLAQRREAAQLLVGLPPRRETAAALTTASSDADPEVSAWASVGAVRLGVEAARPRVRAIVEAPAKPASGSLRVRAALALATVGDATGVPVLASALDECEEVLLCRLIVLSLGKLRDARAVPGLLKHLPEVQNRREMVDALGDIGDRAARDALVQRLHSDEYVPVRVQAAAALAKLGDPSVIPALEQSARRDTEPTVVEAARAAARALAKAK
jgi:arylsulfatase A-like enzyme/HEAT repeat protein